MQSKEHQGLTDAEVLTSRQKNGRNELATSKNKAWWMMALQVLKEPMFILLVACASLYSILGDFREGAILMSQVLVVIGIMYYQERKTEKALSAIRDLSSPKAFVVRNGQMVRVEGWEVVVGDTIVLQEGDRVPADAKILDCVNLSIDESLLTGESAPVVKSVWHEGDAPKLGGEDTTHIYSASLIVQGKGHAEVLETGFKTAIGKIGKSLDEVKDETTHLQTEINQIVKVFSISGAVIFVVSIVTFGLLRGEWLKGLLAALSVSMAMLPEEFPVVLTVFMALGAWRMAQHNILARKVATIETLGSATVLCVDKTGTITENKMRVEQLFAKDVQWKAGEEWPKEMEELLRFAMLAGQPEPFDPMEKAIKDLGAEHSLTNAENPKLAKEYPLSKELMAMTRVYEQDQGHLIAAVKGAPEAIFALCHTSPSESESYAKLMQSAADEGMRVLGVAKALQMETMTSEQLPEAQSGLTFELLGLVAMSDPVRKEVPQAIAECYTAGIRVLMITGDYAGTAKHIARAIGLNNADASITGVELTELSDDALLGVIKEVNVYARVLPEQKLRLVELLKSQGEIVAMTGDGINDAPALKAAHIGIAMGGKGTDVARETASLVLLDDNFASIVVAVKMGRRIFDNLQKAMIYIFAIHIPIIGMSIMPMMTSFLPLMLLPIHIAFLELVIDPACSIVFEAEGAEADIMQRPPRVLKERFFSFHKIRLGVFQGLGLAVAVFGVYFIGLWLKLSENEVRGMTFTTLLIGNLSLILTNRSLHKSIFTSFQDLKNPTLWWMIGAVLLLSVSVVYVPFMSSLFKIQMLSWYEYLIAFGAGFLSIAWFEVVKVLHKPKIIKVLPPVKADVVTKSS